MVGAHLKYTKVSPFMKWYYAHFGMPYIGLFIKQVVLSFNIPQLCQSRRILDAGCGQGLLSFWLADQLPETQIDAIDINTEYITQAQYIQQEARTPNLSFHQLDLCHTAFGPVFDIALCFDVMEHVVEDERMLQNIRSILKKCGRLLVHVPLRHQMQIRVFGHWVPWQHKDHVRDEYTLNEICTKIGAAGFDIEECTYTYGGWTIPIWEIGTAMRLKHPCLNLWLFPLLRSGCSMLQKPRYSKGNGILVWARRRET